jgi:hypothetical protein
MNFLIKNSHQVTIIFCPFTLNVYGLPLNQKKMSRKKSEFNNVVSFRLSPEEKENLERITQLFKTTKSEFLRDWTNRLLTIVKN